MFNISKWLELALSILPLVHGVVTQVEEVSHRKETPTPGPEKRVLAHNIVRDHLETVGVPWTEGLDEFVDRSIESTVKINNRLGVFVGHPEAPVDESEEEAERGTGPGAEDDVVKTGGPETPTRGRG